MRRVNCIGLSRHLKDTLLKYSRDTTLRQYIILPSNKNQPNVAIPIYDTIPSRCTRNSVNIESIFVVCQSFHGCLKKHLPRV